MFQAPGKGTGVDVSCASKDGGLLLTINGKTGWREVENGRGFPLTCPAVLLETWLRLSRVSHGPLFRRVARNSAGVTAERLTDKHVARLVQKTTLAAGIGDDLSEGERKLAFAGHSLRAGLASSAQIEEAHVQKHLGRASAEMTRRYQRKRDRFKVNLTKAGGCNAKSRAVGLGIPAQNPSGRRGLGVFKPRRADSLFKANRSGRDTKWRAGKKRDDLHLIEAVAPRKAKMRFSRSESMNFALTPSRTFPQQK